jgi:RNA polymerase sigma factor (sigma-70 family)
MDSVKELVERAAAGTHDAYAVIVRRFQGMAVGYAYASLHDFQLAEDAAQEAFFEAFSNLSKLREPAAFGGWLRRIVFKQCDRILRAGKPTLALDAVAEAKSDGKNPSDVLEESEMKQTVRQAIEALREHERSTVVLYYIGGHSQEEVADFLEVPVTTVKKRLHDARQHLREILMDNIENDLRAQRPSRTERFAQQVIEFIAAARNRDIERIQVARENGYEQIVQLLSEGAIQ